ncbi:cystathionine gamma-synthase [[Haemophilus] ducreyi]|uniref:Cytochrome c-type biogenesis protein n=1 Tax=Haemophilus ducreyi TaxID=730 RepID=A0AAC8UB28_HAEDC|nr:cytochrome c-type biogenesis protein [[Haemophilus] ducreyi]AKO30254.1 cystathionine gamma-synthase [[Haemophilus] ducreyi]AKO31687.1 cystathionine gamma-synthase [[Haemophilus] ducreyi]AKO33140.1 cystathionine gamma-synthase [[Haemophilus] ducreyi]AKO34589.1 cystathionine gamma-synthase [[Haemophilus] ducreyi]AKO36023.1 cystathionine gamma-synthase [[Haemophilus] ducreyi]
MKKHLAILLLTASVATAAPVEFNQFDNAQQEADYQALIQELRCPQCQNNNIADSNATIATDMRHKTLELLKQGKTKPEVVDYMIERYGNFVTYDPPLTPATIFLWLLPLALILLGLGWVFVGKKKPKQAVDSTENSAKLQQDQARLKQLLDNKDKL